ncbi:MAG: YraN family protein [Gammaproteobacteria bacterium]|nr:YraN family protein [Gammaproteobacteria bacterium]
MPSPRQISGQQGEDRAIALLAGHGLHPLTRNYRCRMGEIDIITLDGDTLVFVEVRQRAHKRQGGAAASITGRKQKRLIRAAEYFLLRNPQHGLRPCRFDVVALDGAAPADWIRDAFRVPSP